MKENNKNRPKSKSYCYDFAGNRIPLGPLPDGYFLVHSGEYCSYNVEVKRRTKFDRFIPCKCNLGTTLPLAEVPKHYRYPKRGYTVTI